MDTSPILSQEDHHWYRSLVGMALWAAILCRIDILCATIQLTKFQAAPREGHLRAALRVWGYLKNNPRFGILIDPSDPIFTPNKTKVDHTLFDNIYPDATEQIASGFPWENSVTGLTVWACVDSALNTDLRNGQSSTGCVVMVGNTPVVEKTLT